MKRVVHIVLLVLLALVLLLAVVLGIFSYRNLHWYDENQRNLKRAGLDYWDDVKIIHHASTKAFLDEHSADNLYFFTGQAERSYAEVDYAGEVFLVFGRESRGIDPEILERYAAQCVRIPMKEGLRSLNLSNAAAIGAYEALHQNGFSGLV